MKKIFIITVIGFMLLAGLFISNQQGLTSSTSPIIASTSNVEALPVVGDDQTLKKLLSEVEKNSLGYGRAGMGLEANLSIDSGAVTAKSAAPTDTISKQTTSYSETNVQVAGVDEADIIKTDGKYLYQISYNIDNTGNSQVIISKIYPANDLQVVSKLKFDRQDFRPREMYVDSKSLVILGDGFEHMEKVQPLTKVLVYDLADKINPKKIREVKLDGRYISSRKIGSAVYFVANKYIDYYRILKQNEIPIKPSYSDSLNKDKANIIDYSQIRYFPGTVEPNYLMIAGLDLDRPNKEVEVSTYLGSGRNLYASTSNLYVAVPHYEFEQKKDTTTKDTNTKDTLIRQMPVKTTTIIYKFDFNKGETVYKGKGEVPGQILNQFSMDEHQGYFRIATTKGDPWGGAGNLSTNNVYILNEDLKASGSLEGLAPGEKIYSVRFMGNRAYMVTFKTVDPLFVLDLNDPRNPKVLGELKIPGYSDYLHPYDENHLIGIGKETVESTMPLGNGESRTVAYYLGMKLAMFDVSDVSHPKELYKETIGDRGTDSEALRNHKAILFDKEKNLLAFPISVYEVIGARQKEIPYGAPPQYGQQTFQGAYVYKISLEKGFSLKGKITHKEVKNYEQKSAMQKPGVTELTILPQEPRSKVNQAIQRIIYVGENLYTISQGKIKVNDLETLEEKGIIELN